VSGAKAQARELVVTVHSVPLMRIPCLIHLTKSNYRAIAEPCFVISGGLPGFRGIEEPCSVIMAVSRIMLTLCLPNPVDADHRR
jgi:hypothetical protein